MVGTRRTKWWTGEHWPTMGLPGRKKAARKGFKGCIHATWGGKGERAASTVKCRPGLCSGARLFREALVRLKGRELAGPGRRAGDLSTGYGRVPSFSGVAMVARGIAGVDGRDEELGAWGSEAADKGASRCAGGS